MDLVFSSNDLEQYPFSKGNLFFNSDSDKDKVTIVIDKYYLKINKFLLAKNFNFFLEKFALQKNKNESFNILQHLDMDLFMTEDIEFIKYKFFSFLNFLFTKNKSQNFKININEIIKFIEICIIFEPKDLIVEKIHKTIYLSSKLRSALKFNCNKTGGKFFNDKLDFLMQKLENFKNLNTNSLKENSSLSSLKDFQNKTSKSSFDSSSNISKANLGLANAHLNNPNNLPNFLGINSTDNLNQKLKNSIFFRYSFNLIRHLYDLPLALLLRNKSSDDLKPYTPNNQNNPHNHSANNINYSSTINNCLNYHNNNHYNSLKTNHNFFNKTIIENSKNICVDSLNTNASKNDNYKNSFYINGATKNSSNMTKNYSYPNDYKNSSQIKKIPSNNSISSEKIKTLNSYCNHTIIDKKTYSNKVMEFHKKNEEYDQLCHDNFSYNLNNLKNLYLRGENDSKNPIIYNFKNKQLEVETINFFEKKNQGFFVFVDKLFSEAKSNYYSNMPKNHKQKKYEDNDKKERKGLLPNRNYLASQDSRSSSSINASLKISPCGSQANLKNAFKKKKSSGKLIKKSLENILLKEFTETNKEFSRYFLMKNLQNFDLKCEKAILIQKNFRRYMGYKNYLLKIKDYFKFRFISCITKIQAFYRSFIYRKKLKIKFLLEDILRFRLIAKTRILRAMKKYNNKIKYQKNIIIQRILLKRFQSFIMIQKHYRGYTIRKVVSYIFFREKNFYKITYPFKAEKVQLKLYIPRPINEKKGSFEIFSDEKIYDFYYCNFREMHILYINTHEIKPGKYRALLMVDGSSTCDGRYPHVEFSDGYYYNIIDIRENNFDKIRNTKSNSHKNDCNSIQNSSSSYRNNINSNNTLANKNTNVSISNNHHNNLICNNYSYCDSNNFINNNNANANNFQNSGSKHNFNENLLKSNSKINNFSNFYEINTNNLPNQGFSGLNNSSHNNIEFNNYLNKAKKTPSFSSSNINSQQTNNSYLKPPFHINLNNNGVDNKYYHSNSFNILINDTTFETNNNRHFNKNENLNYQNLEKSYFNNNNFESNPNNFFNFNNINNNGDQFTNSNNNIYIRVQQNRDFNIDNYHNKIFNNQTEYCQLQKQQYLANNYLDEVQINQNNKFLANEENVENKLNSKETLNSNNNNNEEEDYFNDWNYCYRELKRNLWIDNSETKTICYMDRIRESVQNENNVFDFEF